MQRGAEDLSYGPRDDFPVAMAAMPANARQRRIGMAAIILMAAAVVATLPFVNVELGRVDGFAPIVQTAMCIAGLLMAAFLFAQYAVQPRRSLLVLASGFVFSGLFAFIDALAFPGAFGPGTLFGDGLFTPAWLFIFWQTVFPSAVIAYSLLRGKDRADDQSRRSPGVTIGVAVMCVALATAGLTWIATAGVGYLPKLYLSQFSPGLFIGDVAVFLTLLSTAAVVLLFVRRRTILDEWLIVTLLAWLPNHLVAILFGVVRFTAGWYMSRVYALIAGSALLFALLAEMLSLYVRLARERAYRRAIFDTVVDGIISIDDKGVVESMNPAAAHMFGYSREEAIGRNVKMLVPHWGVYDAYLGNYLATGQAKVIGVMRELTGQRNDGSTFPMEMAVGETTVAGRRIFTGVIRGTTRRKRREKQRDLLISELDHRVKNILARVAVAAKFTSRGSGSTQERFQAFDNRIQSMAEAHALLSQSHWQGVNLSKLVCGQLAPYTTSTNMTIAGPDIVLSAEGTQAVAMVLQELVTNAVKHGSLATENGRISVCWNRRSDDDGTPRVIIAWREIGGPSAVAPAQPSYGTRLIRGLIPQELGGSVDLTFTPDGVRCDIEFPLASSETF